MISLSKLQTDALVELINIGIGKSASALNSLINKHITLNVPFVTVLSYSEMLDSLNDLTNEKYTAVTLPFTGDLIGNTKLVFSSKNAAKIADVFTGDKFADADMDSIRSEVLNEIGNIVINSVMGTFSNMLNANLNYIVPTFEEGPKTIMAPKLSDNNKDNIEPVLLRIQTDFIINEIEVSGNFIIFFEMNSFNTLIDKINTFLNI